MAETIRDYIILSGNHRINILLKVINEKSNLGFVELSNECKHIKPKKLGGGTFWHTLKDARIMGLVENGYGFHLTEFGKKFLNNFSQEVNKDVHLKTPLFRRCFEELPDETNYEKVRDWFLPHIQEVDKKLRGTVIRRYFEGIYGIVIKKLPRVNVKPYKSLRDYTSQKPTSVVSTISSGGGGGGGGSFVGGDYLDFFKSHNISNEKIAQILTIISNIPEDKQETSLKFLLKKNQYLK